MTPSRRPLSIASLVAAVLLTTGCATTTTTAPTPTPTATATPAETPTPTPTPAPVTTPTLPFGGDCAQLLSADELDEFLGDGWATREEMYEEWDIDPLSPGVAFVPLETIGAMECRWYPAEQKDGLQQIAVMVAPADSVPDSFTQKFSEPRCEGNYDGSSCYLVRTEGDAWLMATVGNLIEEPPVALLEGILDAAAGHLAQPLDAESVSRDGWWTLPSCEDLGAAMQLEELIGPNYNTGFWEGTESPELIMLREGGVSVLCEWSTGSGETAPDGEYYVTSVHIANGADWQWDDIATVNDAQEVTVAGAERAVLVDESEGNPGRENLFASDGVNVIEVDGGDDDFKIELAERALAALR